MDARILVVSDELVEIRKGSLFCYLAGLNQVYHVGFADALEQYRETVEDGWDVVIIDGGLNDGSVQLIQELYEIKKQQQIIVIDTRLSEVQRTTIFGVIVPRNADILSHALQELGIRKEV